MHSTRRAPLLLLLAPLTLTLGGTEAYAKKHHHSKDKDKDAAVSATVDVQVATPAVAPAVGATVGAGVGVAGSAVGSVGSAVGSVGSATVGVAGSVASGAAAAVPNPSGDPTAPLTEISPVTPPGPPAIPPPPVRRNGVRFRGGIAIGGGGEFVSGFTAGLGGIDGHLGVQINNLVGVYVIPHISFGAGQIGSSSGATGNAAATVVVDFTFINRIFVGAGAGYGLVNNPNGPVAQLRFGGYPAFKWSETQPRRKGLMVAVDARSYFTPLGAVVQAMLGIGYEAY